MSYYHTYRPQNFSDIAQTQAQVARQLVGSLVSGKVSNAYLFTGSHGIGKTSSARILAKALNCDHYAQFSSVSDSSFHGDLRSIPFPCDVCFGCKAILSGSAVDVVEIDAASHRGIDDIRDLRENIRLAPALLRKKVYIIDEVHMLTTEAFNALLKTLEEPPAHALFILCTTDKERVPMTIQSRCTLVFFRKPSIETLVGYLRYIAEAEHLSVTSEALQYIAHLSQGAYRDAAKLLEQSSLVSSSITLDVVTSLFHGIDARYLTDIFATFADGNVHDFLTIVRHLETHVVDFSKIIQDIIEQFRLFILYKSGVDVSGMISGTSNFDVSTFVSSHDYAYFSECIDILLKALQQVRFSPIAALPLEIAGLRIISLHSSRLPSFPKTTLPTHTDKKVSHSKKSGHSFASCASVLPDSSRIFSSLDMEQSSSTQMYVHSCDRAQSNMIFVAAPLSSDSLVAHSGSHVADSVAFDVVQSRWHEVVRLLRRYNASMATLMNKCKPVRLEGKTLIIETNYSFHKDMLESSKNKPVIEQAIFELLGVQLRIKGSLSNTRLTPQQVDNVTEVSHDDLVLAVREIFGA